MSDGALAFILIVIVLYGFAIIKGALDNIEK